MITKSLSTLPPMIRITIEERRGYHQRFFYTLMVATCLLFIIMLLVVWVLIEEHIVVQLFLNMIWFVFFCISGYFAIYHRNKKRVLDNSLERGDFSVLSGTLDGIQCLGDKRVRYIIDGSYVDGTLIFSGFMAFQNTYIKDVITTSGQAVKLYILPGKLIAGAIYPALDSETTTRTVGIEDWRVISQSQWGGLKFFGWLGLVVSIILLITQWLIERKIGGGWDTYGLMFIIFNGIVLLMMGVHVLINLSRIRALMDKHHPSVQMQVYRGISNEWYLTRTWQGGQTTILDGWIRLAGGLHRIQNNLSPAHQGFLDPLWTSVQLEYLVYKGRLIFVRQRQEVG